MHQEVSEKIKQLCGDGAIQWTNHVITRLLQRNISQAVVKHCLMQGEIIEEYLDDYPYPSYLVLGFVSDADPLHIVCGVADDRLWIITAYKPDKDLWESDFCMRRGN